MRPPRLLIMPCAFAMALAACGSSGDDTRATEASATSIPEGDSSPNRDADAESTVDEAATGEDDPAGVDALVENLEETQAAQGGGGATLRVGDQVWEFDSVLCAFGADEIGQEGAELVVSSIQDGLQLYVSIDSFGHLVSLDDIEDFENPSVSLSADAFNTELAGAETEFVVLDGRSVSADTLFFDGTDDTDTTGTPGSLEATCP